MFVACDCIDEVTKLMKTARRALNFATNDYVTRDGETRQEIRPLLRNQNLFVHPTFDWGKIRFCPYCGVEYAAPMVRKKEV